MKTESGYSFIVFGARQTKQEAKCILAKMSKIDEGKVENTGILSF